MGKILYTKINLEDEMSEVVQLYEDINIDINKEEEFINFKLTKDIEVITPGLNLVLKNPYKLEITRSILNE